MNAELLKEMERLYYEEKRSTRQVAAVLGVQSNTVITYLNSFSNGTRDMKEACLLRTNDGYREKLKEKQLGELNNSAKLNAEKVLFIRKEYEELLSEGLTKTRAQYYLAYKYGVKRPTISDVVLKRTWKHI